MQLGIKVLFAAGNCGDQCPDNRCGYDTGGGKSIWGANGHKDVMTIGAVNENEELIGYSSIGPAALHSNKPDFCGISHFKGYNGVDTGTSAACPVVAGAVALLLQNNTHHSQNIIKFTLEQTAKQIPGYPPLWNANTGYGLIKIDKANTILNQININNEETSKKQS